MRDGVLGRKRRTQSTQWREMLALDKEQLLADELSTKQR